MACIFTFVVKWKCLSLNYTKRYWIELSSLKGQAWNFKIIETISKYNQAIREKVKEVPSDNSREHLVQYLTLKIRVNYRVEPYLHVK